MKNTLLFIPLALSLAACSSDKSGPIEPIKERTYDASSGFKLYYNGEIMPSKSATVSQDGEKGTLKIFSTFDLSQLSGLGLTGKVNGPGALPGSPVTELQLNMTQGGDYWDFAGDGDTDYCTFNYAGFANADRFELYLNDVKLKSGGVKPSVWQPAPIKKGKGIYESLPFYLKWDYDPIPGVDLNLSPIMEALATLPIIPVYNNTAYMSVSQALSQVVRTVAFREDGNIIVTYVSTAFGAAQVAQTPANRYQYAIVSPEMVKLYIDPTSLMGALLVATSGGTPADEVTIIGNGMYPSGVESTFKPGAIAQIMASETGSKIIKNCLSLAMPLLSEGFPFAVNASADSLDLYLDTELAAPLMKAILLPMLQDNSTLQVIKEYLESQPELAPFLPDIEKALMVLPQALERTTDFRIGLAFVPYS